MAKWEYAWEYGDIADLSDASAEGWRATGTQVQKPGVDYAYVEMCRRIRARPEQPSEEEAPTLVEENDTRVGRLYEAARALLVELDSNSAVLQSSVDRLRVALKEFEAVD